MAARMEESSARARLASAFYTSEKIQVPQLQLEAAAERHKKQLS